MKRLGIYLTYDKQNKVDRYIGYFLKELKSCVSSLVVVCNMEEIVQGEENIRSYADQVYFRKNIGFDAGGFKDALCNLIGWGTVLSYDELVLANDSMFGPFCPMENIFQKMETMAIDFWGLTKHGERKKRSERPIPEYLQSFFLVVRSRMLHSCHFKRYWAELPYYNSFEQTIRGYEESFASYFARFGYTYGMLADNDANDSINLENNYNQWWLIPDELIRKRNFPFLKKKPIGTFISEETSQINFYHALNYIDQGTDYPIEFIWETIIRIFNVSDLYKKLCLRYIISPVQDIKNVNAVVLMFISYESSYEYICEYLERLSGLCRVVICSASQEILRPYEELEYECKELHSEELLHFLSEFCAYDYVCVLHDTDMTSIKEPSFVGKSLFYNIWENLVKDKQYVAGVIAQFEKEPQLGFLTVPQSNCGAFFGKVGLGWNGEYENVSNTVSRIGLECNLSAAKPPYRVTEDFWIRGCILKRLELMSQEDIRLLPYLWSYLAQDAGYYSGIVECTEYAAMNEVNLQYYLEQICSQVRMHYGEFQNFFALHRLINNHALQSFCEKYEQLYVYGTGEIARNYQEVLDHAKAYIVSDGQAKQDTFYGIPVKYLSEIDLSHDCGIVLCLNQENQTQVIQLLKARNFTNYFCV